MKFKKIPKDYLQLCFDRLTRFKPTYEKYERVFSDIINKFASKETREEISSVDDMTKIVTTIINSSSDGGNFRDEIKEFEQKTFYQNSQSEKFLNNEINFPYPPKKIKKVVLCEGATEEILLPTFAKHCNISFDDIYILGAGGKNQVGRKYLKMLDEVKLPIFILLDFDAIEIKEMLLPKLREIDDIYLIQSGEFEDILPQNLIIKALNFHFKDGYQCSEKDFSANIKMTKNLDEIFKINGFGEFKKAEFATIIKNYLENHNCNLGKIQNFIERIARDD